MAGGVAPRGIAGASNKSERLRFRTARRETGSARSKILIEIRGNRE